MQRIRCGRDEVDGSPAADFGDELAEHLLLRFRGVDGEAVALARAMTADQANAAVLAAHLPDAGRPGAAVGGEAAQAAQAQVDWAHFSAVIVGHEAVDLVALHVVLSCSRQEAIVWARSKDMLAWLGCHAACFTRLGGVPATLRVDCEKIAIARGAGAWGTINPTYRRYAGLMKFHVDACAPRQPQRKGKVERRVRGHRAALDPYGRSFRDLAELQAWTDARLVAGGAARPQARRSPRPGR